jgi:hypothetical protein
MTQKSTTYLIVADAGILSYRVFRNRKITFSTHALGTPKQASGKPSRRDKSTSDRIFCLF